MIVDSVSALGVMIAFYYGLTGFSCVWYYRKTLSESARNLWLRGILPLLGGLILWFCMCWSFWYYWNPANSDTWWTVPGTHRLIGGVFILDVGVLLLGIVLMYVYRRSARPTSAARSSTATRPTRVPEDIGVPVGLFGIEPFDGRTDGGGDDDKEPTEAG